MSKLYEQVNNYCEMGFYPIVSDSKQYIIVSPTKDSGGDWRDSCFRESLKDATENIGYSNGYSKENWDKKESEGWKIIGFYHPQIKRFKVGDKVRVRGDLKDLYYGGDWTNYGQEYQDSAGLTGEITCVGGYFYGVYFDSLGDAFKYSHEQLEPYIEEEPEKPQTINIGGKEYEITPELTKALKNLKEIE